MVSYLAFLSEQRTVVLIHSILVWGKTEDSAMQNGSCFFREWEARGAASSTVLHFNSSALRESFRCGSMAVKCQKKVEKFVLLSHIKSINLLKQA